MPLSTSSRPNDLCTFSARTIGRRPSGAPASPVPSARSSAPPAPAPPASAAIVAQPAAARRLRPYAAGEVPLQVVLPDQQHAGQRPGTRGTPRPASGRPGRSGCRSPAAGRTARWSPARTTTSEVSLSIAMVSLPVGGMITRIACGSTIRRSIWPRLMPSAGAASVWPRRPTGCRPARSRPCTPPRTAPAPSRPATKPVSSSSRVDAEEPRVEVVDAEQLADLLVERQAERDPRPQDAQVAEEDRQHQPRAPPGRTRCRPRRPPTGSGSATAA